MSKIRGTCIYPGCSRLQHKRGGKPRYRAVCKKHCGMSPNQKTDEQQKQKGQKKRMTQEVKHEIRLLTSRHSYESFVRNS